MPSFGSGPVVQVNTNTGWVDQSPSQTDNELTPAKLRFVGAVEFGSRALGVEHKHSDYDFAILRSTYDKLQENKEPFREFPVKNYFKVVPKSGNNSIATAINFNGNDYLDLLILEHKEDLEAIRRSITTLKIRVPLGLHNKQYRIVAFERELLKNGFILLNKYKIIKWIATKLDAHKITAVIP